jgi:hypothetical protein
VPPSIKHPWGKTAIEEIFIGENAKETLPIEKCHSAKFQYTKCTRKMPTV